MNLETDIRAVMSRYDEILENYRASLVLKELVRRLAAAFVKPSVSAGFCSFRT
jgi:hypothetical protein